MISIDHSGPCPLGCHDGRIESGSNCITGDWVECPHCCPEAYL